MATTLAYGTTWLVLFVFVVALFVSAVPFRLAPAAVCVVAALAVAASLSRSWNGATIDTAASWGLSIIFAGYITLLLHRRDVLIGELRVTQGEVARLAAADAVAEERLRFARDLHDLLGHSLSVIVLKTELAGRLFDSGAGPQARAEVGDAEEIARRSLAEVRECINRHFEARHPGSIRIDESPADIPLASSSVPAPADASRVAETRPSERVNQP